MDILVWVLMGIMAVLLAIVIGLAVTMGDQRDKLQQARADLGVMQSARTDYEERLHNTANERDRVQSQVDQLRERLGVLAGDKEYQEYLKTTHQVLNDFRDVRRVAEELTALRSRIDAQRRDLEARGVLHQGFASLDEARQKLAKETQEFEASQRVRRAEHERKLVEVEQATKEQFNAMKQSHEAELHILQAKLDARRAPLEQKKDELDRAEQELRKREEDIQRQSTDLQKRREELSKQIEGLENTRSRVHKELVEARNSFAALGYLLEGDGLVCGTDWRTYKPEEVSYVPRMTVRPLLADGDKTVLYTRAEALELIKRQEWTEWIARERRELKSPEQQLGSLFEVKCPNGHSESLWPRSTHWVVPIIGGTSSGKTLYVTALLNELRNTLPHEYGFECEPADTTSNTNYISLRKMVFNDRVIRPTPTGQKKDMIYGIAPLDKSNSRRLTVFFRDISGEYWQKDLHTNPETHGPFLLAAPCIMVLVDPLADPQLRNIIKESVRSRSEEFGDFSALPTPEEIMTSVTLFLRKHGGYENTIIPKDLLMVLTKADLLDKILFSEEDPIRKPIEPGRPFASYRINEMSDSIVAKLRQRDALRAVVDPLPGQYKSVRWFAASALGYPLEASYRGVGKEDGVTLANEPRPKHVTDPILHCMWLSGLLS